MNLSLPFTIDQSSNATTTRNTNDSLKKFTTNLHYNIITPLPFEQFPEDIFTVPLVREHHDSYLYYIHTHTLIEDSSFLPISIIFNDNTNIYTKHIYPSNIFLPISQVFLAFLSKIEEMNNALDQPIFLPSAISELQSKESFFEIPNLEQLRQINDNPHYWLQTDLLQLKQFQYQFFHNITLNDKTIPQIRIYSLFLRKFLRHNYQLMWDDKDQNAFLNFPSHFTENELLPFIISDQNRDPQYLDLTKTPVEHLNLLTFDQMSIQHSSPLPTLKRPYATITQLTSDHFNTNSPDTISVRTHVIDPNPTDSSLNNPSTSNVPNPTFNQPFFYPNTTLNSPFATPTTSPTLDLPFHKLQLFLKLQ